MEKSSNKTKNTIINAICLFMVVAFLVVTSILVVKYVQTQNYNRRLTNIKNEIEDDYQELLDQSLKLQDDTYYTIYFQDQYMVVDKDNIVVEFK